MMVEITYAYKRHPLDSSRNWKLICFLWFFATRFVEKTKPTKQMENMFFSGCKIQKKTIAMPPFNFFSNIQFFTERFFFCCIIFILQLLLSEGKTRNDNGVNYVHEANTLKNLSKIISIVLRSGTDKPDVHYITRMEIF